MASTKASRCAPSSRCFRRNEALDFPLHAELRAFALEQRLEGRFVLHAFVDFHVGRRVVAPAHPARLHAEVELGLPEKILHPRPQRLELTRRNLVVDVVVQTGITARASPAALSTITPPLNSSPGLTLVPGGSCRRVMRRLTSPRCWARATISWPG